MNDHSAAQKMSRPPQLQPMMSQPPPVMNPAPVPISVQPVLVQSQLQSMNPPPQLIGQMAPANVPPAPVAAPVGMNPSQTMFVAQRSYKPWGPQSQQQLQNPNNKFNKKNNNSIWKGKKGKSNKDWRMEKMQISNLPFVINNNNPTKLPSAGGVGGAGGGYKPPSLNELQTQNRMKARKYYHPKKKFNDNNSRSNRNNRFAPYAPRNTSSFIIRAKKAGGIAEMVSPCPVTPAVLPTPIFSPSREVLGDMAKEEWGVDGYGSMKGLIRLRSPQGAGNDGVEGEEEDEEGNGSSESDVEEHVEVERRLDHDLSRFEMIYPSYYSAGGGGAGGEYSYGGYNNVLENRVDDQGSHIAQLEEENLTLKERLFLMERELGDLRRRLQFLERQQFGSVGGGHGREYVNEEVVENVSENDENESDGGSDVGGGNRVENEGREEVMQYVSGYGGSVRDDINGKEEKNDHNTEDVVGDEADIVKPEVDDEMAGSGKMVTAVDENVKDGGLTDGVVANYATTKEDEVMGEHTVLENVNADPERDVVHDANA